MSRVAEVLHEEVVTSHRLAAALDEEDFPLQPFLRLQSWQRDRLARTYEDLHANPRYAAATTFFLDELYGGLDFRERDQELMRVLPIMTRLLPERALAALHGAFELQNLSLELDMAMTEAWLAAGQPELTAEHYASVYRATGQYDRREVQIALIQALGQALNRIAGSRVIHRLVRMLRGPARASGFERLQQFLEEGLRAFNAMGDAHEFVSTIVQRERRIMENIQAGRPQPLEVAA